jgi:cytochrome P450
LNGECDGLDSYVVIGFSAGARACPGKHLALLESKIGMIKMLKRYKKI